MANGRDETNWKEGRGLHFPRSTHVLICEVFELPVWQQPEIFVHNVRKVAWQPALLPPTEEFHITFCSGVCPLGITCDSVLPVHLHSPTHIRLTYRSQFQSQPSYSNPPYLRSHPLIGSTTPIQRTLSPPPQEVHQHSFCGRASTRYREHQSSPQSQHELLSPGGGGCCLQSFDTGHETPRMPRLEHSQ
jgi:hypothetical protein